MGTATYFSLSGILLEITGKGSCPLDNYLKIMMKLVAVPL